MESTDSRPATPKVYRVMKRDADGFPTTGASASTLGVRPHADVHLDANDEVLLDGCGMSVVPRWRLMLFTRVPKRLIALVPGARGSDKEYCFCAGAGGFVRAGFADGLELIPDPGDAPVHGVIAPTESVHVDAFQSALWATRESWFVDES